MRALRPSPPPLAGASFRSRDLPTGRSLGGSVVLSILRVNGRYTRTSRPAWAHCPVATRTFASCGYCECVFALTEGSDMTLADARLYGEVIASGDTWQPESLAVVCDGRLAVSALVALLLKDPRRSVVRVARGRDDVRASLVEFEPAVVVAEANSVDWPVGLDPHTWGGRTLVLFGPEDVPKVLGRLARPHGDGYLCWTRSHRALERAIASVACAGHYVDPQVANSFAAAMRKHNDVPARAGRPLSQREREILGQISSGRSSKEIARRCGIKTKTVRNHVSNVYAKLNFHHRGQLVLYAAQLQGYGRTRD